jgi:rhodanese-related sulfurtransferase
MGGLQRGEDKTMPSSIKEMLAEANAAVPRLNPAEVRETIGKGNVLIVDERDAPELAAGGKLKGAVNVSRGMLEFRADPDSPYHNPAFQKDKIVLVYCASGGRSALVSKILKDFGYESVFNAGGFKELADAGLETEPA